MRKPNLLEDEGKERGNKWVVYCVIIVGVLIGAVAFFGLIWFSDMESYLSNKDIVKLYNHYDLNLGENETCVYILGDSFVSYSIYSPMLNQQLKEMGYNISEYNLAILGGVPLMWSLQTQNIIDSNPSLVIMGVSYRHLSAGNYWIDERVYLVDDRLKINPDSLYIYTPDQLYDINSDMSVWYAKKFFISALLDKIHGVSYNNTIIPYNGYMELGPRPSMQHSPEETLQAAHDKDNSFRAEIDNESTQNKEAVLYMAKKFNENNIPFVLINAPLNPVLSKEISESSRNNLHNFLNSTGVDWYDMEFSMDENYFIDIYHLSGDGAVIFTPKVTDIIIQEVNKNVIHNS